MYHNIDTKSKYLYDSEKSLRFNDFSVNNKVRAVNNHSHFYYLNLNITLDRHLRAVALDIYQNVY